MGRARWWVRPAACAALAAAVLVPAGLAATAPGGTTGAGGTDAGAERAVTATSTQGGPITRAEVIARAKSWLDPKVPYSMSQIHSSGYRQDCSGFVSMAWHISRPGLSTVTLPGVSVRIGKSDLKAGDVLMKGGPGTAGAAGHVAVFERWADSARTRYWAIEQAGSTNGTVRRVVPYPYLGGGTGYLPYRYPNIVDTAGAH